MSADHLQFSLSIRRVNVTPKSVIKSIALPSFLILPLLLELVDIIMVVMVVVIRKRRVMMVQYYKYRPSSTVITRLIIMTSRSC